MRISLFAAAALAAAGAWAQTAAPPIPTLPAEAGSLASIPKALMSETLSVAIVASVGKKPSAPDWTVKDTKYTIPGSSVSVKMLGTDVAILITVTPYKMKDGRLLLLTQGQVWYKEGAEGLNYRTTIETLSVKFGERVLFYPFGAKPEGGAPLRIELVLDKYQLDTQPKPPASVPASAPPPPPPPGPPPPVDPSAPESGGLKSSGDKAGQ